MHTRIRIVTSAVARPRSSERLAWENKALMLTRRQQTSVPNAVQGKHVRRQTSAAVEPWQSRHESVNRKPSVAMGISKQAEPSPPQ